MFLNLKFRKAYKISKHSTNNKNNKYNIKNKSQNNRYFMLLLIDIKTHNLFFIDVPMNVYGLYNGCQKVFKIKCFIRALKKQRQLT